MITFRPASIQDLELLKYWDTQQHVIDSDPDDDWDWETELGRDPEWREQLVAEYNGEPIGFIQIYSHLWGVLYINKMNLNKMNLNKMNLNEMILR